MMKKLLLIATGGTIACCQTESGLAPQLKPQELLEYVPQYRELCQVDCIQLFSIDSTNMRPEHWVKMAQCVKDNYDAYDGFIICHGTDTMAYTSAALSYLVQNNLKPIVITGAQRPINLPISDARSNLYDSIVYACDDRAWGTCIVFGGKVIVGTRAKKEYSHNYNAFTSINFPEVALIQSGRAVFFLESKSKVKEQVRFYDSLCDSVFLLKMIPGTTGRVLRNILRDYDGVVIETFGVGGLPEDENDEFCKAISEGIKAGKVIVIATQVTHEGSDLSVYRVGKRYKEEFQLMESYDMGLEATVTKVMWAMANSDDADDLRKKFYTRINHDILMNDR